MSLAKKKKQQVAQLTVDAKALHAEMEADAAKQTPENREKLSKMITDGKALRTEVEELESLDQLSDYSLEPEQKNDGLNPLGGDGAFSQKFGERKSSGDLVIGSDQFKAADRAKGEMKSVKVPDFMKAVINTVSTQGGLTIRPERETEILDIARQRPFSILDIVGKGETDLAAVEYVEMSSRTNNANIVPEWDAALTPGAGDYGNKFGTKPQGDLAFALRTAVVKTIAEWIAVSRQILADAPNLRSVIDNELPYQLKYVLENQILSGDGTGNNFLGIMNTSGIQTRGHRDTTTPARNATNTDTRGDTLRRAITDIQLAFYEPDGIAINPGTAENIELEKGSDGHYTMIYDPVQQKIWRVRVIQSNALTAGNAVVGAWQMGTKLWDRQDTEIRVGEPGNFFLQNAVAVLGELRAAFAVIRKQAMEKVTDL